MARDWDPDAPLDLQSAAAIITEQFPERQTQEPFFVGRGWDNFCIGCPDGVVFRIPTRQAGAALVPAELASLAWLAPQLPLPIPVPLFVGLPTPRHPYPFFGYRQIPGATADSRVWTQSESRLAAEAMGGFLQRLHGLSRVGAPAEIPDNVSGKAEPEALLAKFTMRAEQARRLVPEWKIGHEDALALAESLAAAAERSPKAVLVHGDLYPRHMVADEAGEVTGVIDWGDIHWGDPLVDLSLAWTFFDPPARAEFWRAYGRRPEPGHAAIGRLRALMYGAALAAYGGECGDYLALELGLSIVHRCREGA